MTYSTCAPAVTSPCEPGAPDKAARARLHCRTRATRQLRSTVRSSLTPVVQRSPKLCRALSGPGGEEEARASIGMTWRRCGLDRSCGRWTCAMEAVDEHNAPRSSNQVARAGAAFEARGAGRPRRCDELRFDTTRTGQARMIRRDCTVFSSAVLAIASQPTAASTCSACKVDERV